MTGGFSVNEQRNYDLPEDAPKALASAQRRYECEKCDHVAYVEAIFGKGYYFWPAAMCVYCEAPLRDASSDGAPS